LPTRFTLVAKPSYTYSLLTELTELMCWHPTPQPSGDPRDTKDEDEG